MNEGVRALPGSDASLDARRLLEFVLSRRSEWLLAHSDEPVGDVDARSFRRLCSERASGKPLAYIVGAAGFYGREFAVTDAVLVPRPETEHLVEEAIARLRQLEVGIAAHVLDVGTGSGAIACSIAAEVPRALVDATDTSADALVVATENARRIGVADRCRFFEADIMPPGTRVRYDVIVANLPYIPSADVPAKPHALGFEPRAALDGGPDGLDAYRELLRIAPAHVVPGGLLLLEAAPPTIVPLTALVRSAFPLAAVEVRRDFADLERYLRVVAPPART